MESIKSPGTVKKILGGVWIFLDGVRVTASGARRNQTRIRGKNDRSPQLESPVQLLTLGSICRVVTNKRDVARTK